MEFSSWRCLSLRKIGNIKGASTSVSLFVVTHASLCIGLLSVALHYPTLAADFAWDDRAAILQNGDVRGSTPWLHLLQHDFWGAKMSDPESHKSYRPLSVASLRINAFMAAAPIHQSAAAFHAFNIALHAAVSILTLHLLRSFVPHRGAADVVPVIGALVFTVHPAHVDSVAPIVGRADIACGFFTIISLLLRGKGIWRTCLAMLGALCASASKEVGLSAFAILAILEIWEGITQLFSNKGKSRIRMASQSAGWICRGAVAVCGAVFWVWLHVGVRRGAAMRQWGPLENEFASLSLFSHRALSYAHTHWQYAWKLVWPMTLCHDYGYACLPVISKLSDWRNLGPLCLYLVLLFLAVRALQALFDRPAGAGRSLFARAQAVGLGILIISFLPASQIFFPVGTVLAERLLYLPSLGFSMLVACGLGQARLIPHCRLYRLTSLAVLVWCAFAAMRTWRRCWDWRTERSLFESALPICPKGIKTLNNLASLMLNTDEAAKAISLLSVALDVHPNFSSAIFNRALAEYIQGDMVAALADLEHSILLDSTQSKPRIYLAHILLTYSAPRESGMGRAAVLTRALAEVSEAIRLGTYLPLAALTKGVVLYEQGQYVEAAAWLEETLEANDRLLREGYPSAELINVASTVNYMVLALRDGSPSSAVMRVRELCQEALQKFPNDVALLVNCGSTLEREGFPDEAESLYTQALDIDPNRPELLNNIGWLLENKGGDFLLQAKEYYERAAELLLPATHPQIETNRQNIEEKLQALPLFRPPFLHAEQRHGLGLPLLPAM